MGNSSMALHHYITSVNINKSHLATWLLLVRILQIVYSLLSQQLEKIKCIILMVDCNPEMIVCL